MPSVLSKIKGFIYPSSTLSPEQKAALQKLDELFDLKDETLELIVKSFHEQMELGLKGEPGDLLMVPSYVTGRTKADELGEYLALDFGGNLQYIFDLLFAALGDFIRDYVQELTSKGLISPTKELNQTSLVKGTLVRWTKGFANPGAVGREVYKMLQDALDQRDVPVRVNAIVNDTVGTLVSSSYLEPSSQIGLILGTGTNSAYYELTKNIPKLAPEYRENYEEMAINIEWGAFDNGKKILPLTEYDAELDLLTPNPNEQIFEKTISGFYLGELFRIIITHFHKQGLVFQASGLPPTFNSFGGIDTAYLSDMLMDDTPDLAGVAHVAKRKLLAEGESPISLADRIVLKKIAELVGRRAAQFAGTGSAAVLLKRPDLLDAPVTVGVDGSVFEFFPYFPLWMEETVASLVGKPRCHNIRFAIARDGSGIGAALISMLADSQSTDSIAKL
ncbi:hypothetical protein L0F63_003450 [Massospora cicadina]|nr:hypothetical protein L0F63_003450 [Massospora cicadina]